MAKIFRTEVLAVGGDNIRLTATEDGKFSFQNTAGSDIFSNDKFASDVSGLNSDIEVESGNRVAEVSSLNTAINTESTARIANVGSLNTQITGEVQDRKDAVSGAESDIQIESGNRIANVESLANLIQKENVFAQSVTLASGIDAKTIDISAAGFAASDSVAVVGTIRGTAASDPMVGCMLSGTAAHNSVSFAFTDEIPSDTYKIDILASI